MIRSAAAALGALLLAASSAHADPGAVEVGNRGRSGRVVLQTNGSAPPSFVQRGNQIVVRLPGVTVSAPARVPHNVVSISGGQGSATITVDRGASVKPVRTGKLLTLEILDARTHMRGPREAVGMRPNPAWSPPVPATAAPAQPHAPVLQEPLSKPTPPASRAAAIENQSVQSAESTTRAASDQRPPARAPIEIPAGPAVGAVAFRRGDFGIVVLDDKVELPPIGDDDQTNRPTVQYMQAGGTILTFKLGDGEQLALTRDDGGWVVAVGAASATPAVQSTVADGLAFEFSTPGRVMTISDPVTGQTLLLGTSRKAGGAHTRIDLRRSAPGYVLLPTWLGLAVEATADKIDLHASQTGFALQIPDPAMTGTAIAAGGENQFGIPVASQEVLFRRMNAEIASAAVSPPRGRGAERVAAARTMLALGMGAEAQALLGLAANDDPNIANDPAVAALSGIAAVLAQRPAEATGLDNTKLTASGDLALWRGLRDVEQGKSLSGLGKFWPLLLGYPEAVRRRVGPAVLEAAVSDGDPVPPPDLEGPELAFAQTLQKQTSSDVNTGLAALDEAARQRDARVSVRAALAAAEMRLANDKITPAETAKQIELQTVRWRGDYLELAMRLRVAELRTLAGEWRAALESLRETQLLFPDAKDRVAVLKADVFNGLLAAKGDSLNPLEVVTILGDFTDALPSGKDGERLAELLAEKLAALDLPSRAIPVLERLVEQTDPPTAKAEFALRLAQLQLDAGAPDKAETVLASFDPAALPPEKAEQRLLLLARVRESRGDPAGAANLLAGLPSPAGEELRAALLAKAGDWQDSLQALQQLTGSTIPATGDLTEHQQDLLLREATAAVQAGDAAAVRDLRRFDSRMKAPRADLFRLLTANAVEGPDDLPRAARELAMSRSLPERLDALKLR